MASSEDMPRLMTSPEAFRQWCKQQREDEHQLALVPTMGALHEGHLCLVREARRRATRVVVSIFVNPTQFAPNEDLEAYPRNLDRDLATLKPLGIDAVFAPSADSMYLKNDATRVRVTGLTQGLCGASRPAHFDGVTTVVSKLFALSGPCVAVFGQKDFQQLAILRRMTADLFLPVEVVSHPIVRTSDGLALSSRNAFLSKQERDSALGIVEALRQAHAHHQRGERVVARLRTVVERCIERSGLTLDYAEFVDPENLKPVDVVDGPCVVALAARAGSTRLIDNTVLGEEVAP